jgi:imidazolonepropionase-like amidohydrolase
MPQAEMTAIKGGRLIDGTGARPVENATVLIEGSRIAAVGREIEIPAAAKVIDAAGMTVMPGLIDAHLHFFGAKSDKMEARLFRPKELSLIKSIGDARALLEAGFTTAKCCGGTNALYLKRAAAEGTLTGLPRIVAAGYFLSQTFGHGDIHYFPIDCVDARTSRHGIDTLICDGVPECIKATRYALRQDADFIKVMATGGVLSPKDRPADVQFNLDEIRAIVDTAAQAGKFVTAHCQNSPGARNALLGGVKTLDHGNETSDEIIELAKERGAVFVSSLAISRVIVEHGESAGMAPWAVEKAKAQEELMIGSLQRIRRAGAALAAGTDYIGSPLMPLGGNAIELEHLTRYCGFTPLEAIVAATRNGAMACFLGEQTGTVEAGKLADLIVVEGDPLADIAILQKAGQIKMVMLEGKIEVNRDLR